MSWKVVQFHRWVGYITPCCPVALGDMQHCTMPLYQLMPRI